MKDAKGWSRFLTAPIRGWLIAGCLSLFAMTGGPVLAADGNASRSASLDFNIAAQPLTSALAAYGAATGSQLLYNSALVAGRRSGGVTGRLAPEEALRTLLAGSGLVARKTDIDAITIERAPNEQSVVPKDVVPDARFLGAVQAAILGALCRHPETRPGSYQMALQLWISPEQAIQRARLLGSTGDGRRDAMLVGALQNVSIDMPLPAGIPQPLTMMIVPREASAPKECPDP